MVWYSARFLCLRYIVVLRKYQSFYIFLWVYWSFEAFYFSTGCCFYPVAVVFLHDLYLFIL